MSVRRPDGSIEHTYSSQMPQKAQLPDNSEKAGNIANKTDAITGAYTPKAGEQPRSFQDQTSMDNYLRGGNLRVSIKF